MHGFSSVKHFIWLCQNYTEMTCVYEQVMKMASRRPTDSVDFLFWPRQDARGAKYYRYYQLDYCFSLGVKLC